MDGNAFIHCVIILVRDLVIIFGKLMKGSEWQMVLPRSLIVRIGCSILGTCSSAEQMCIVAGRMADLMSSTSNSLSPKMSEIMKPLDECIFKIFRRIRMIFSFFSILQRIHSYEIDSVGAGNKKKNFINITYINVKLDFL